MKNSKWPPKTGFSSIKRELIEIFSKIPWQMTQELFEIVFKMFGFDSAKHKK